MYIIIAEWEHSSPQVLVRDNESDAVNCAKDQIRNTGVKRATAYKYFPYGTTSGVMREFFTSIKGK